ncbi:MAG: hypothetical protein L6V35_02660 [Alistipes putredinis]|nr:MAG: hypothetical protein L6V35_02660 [Alistipes putredinis]
MGMEYSQRRDAECGVEFYSGILLPGMVLPAADWSACRDADFVRARLLGRQGVQVVGDARGIEPFDMNRLIRTHTADLLAERYGRGLLAFAEAATRGGARQLGLSDVCAEFEEGSRCGAVLLTGVDYDAMLLTESLTTERIV